MEMRIIPASFMLGSPPKLSCHLQIQFLELFFLGKRTVPATPCYIHAYLYTYSLSRTYILKIS